MPVLVSPHASLALWPMITNGVEGRVTPVTSSPAATSAPRTRSTASRRPDGGRWRATDGQSRFATALTTQLLLPPARAPTSSHPSPGGKGGSSSAREANGRSALGSAISRLRRSSSDAAVGETGAVVSTIVGAPEGHTPIRRLASAAPMAPVSRPRTSSPQRFSASRHESSRATDKESTGVHGSGSIPSARNSGGRRQRPIWATAAFTPRLYFSSAVRTSGVDVCHSSLAARRSPRPTNRLSTRSVVGPSTSESRPPEARR